MPPAAEALLLAFLAAAAPAPTAPDLASLAERTRADEGVWLQGLTASLGHGRRVTAPLTFDPRRAAAGGLILASPSMPAGLGVSARMLEGLVTAGRMLDPGPSLARLHGVPAILLGDQVLWNAGGAGGIVGSRPVPGEAEKIAGFEVRRASGSVPVRLAEGDIVTLDPAGGRIILRAASEGQSWLSLAAAVRAYDGLRDAGALSRWAVEEISSARDGLKGALAAALISEVAERVGGAAGAADLRQLRSDIAPILDGPARSVLKNAESRVLARERRRVLSALSAAVAEPPSLAGRLLARARAGVERVRLLGEALDSPGGRRELDSGLAALEKRAGTVPEAAPQGMEPLLRGIGVRGPRAVPLPGSFYFRYVAQAGLGESLGRISQDTSLRPGQRSARARELIAGVPIPPDLAREISALLPDRGPWAALVPGAGPRPAAAPGWEGVREAWSALWSPRALGARRRDRRPLSVSEAEVSLARVEPCGVSGALLSRPPGAAALRIAVSAGSGDVEGVVTGRVVSVHLVIDGQGRLLQRPDAPLLAPEGLRKLGRLARVLEAHQGGPVEALYCFAGEDLILWSARELDPAPLPPPGP